MKVPKSSKSVQEHPRPLRRAPSSTSFVRSAISHRPPRGHNATTRATVHPPARRLQTPHGRLDDYDMLHYSFSAAPARGCQKLCRRDAAEPRAHPCLGVWCMTARLDGPRTRILFSRLRAALSLLPRLFLLEFSTRCAIVERVQGHAWLGAWGL